MHQKSDLFHTSPETPPCQKPRSKEERSLFFLLTRMARECSILILSLSILLTLFGMEPLKILSLIAIFSSGLILWKMGIETLNAWDDLSELHQFLALKRWKIEHQRMKEKEELQERYRKEGFSEKLIEQIMDELSYDDNRFLQIIIEKELGLKLGSLDHPLKSGCMAGASTALSCLALFLGFYFSMLCGTFLAAFFLFIISSFKERALSPTQLLQAVVWRLSLALLSIGTIFVIGKWVDHVFF